MSTGSLAVQTLSTTASGAPTTPLLSKVLSWGCALLAIVLVALAAYVPATDMQMLIDGLTLRTPPAVDSLSTFQRIVLGVLSSVGTLCQAYGLLSARRCFQS